MTTTTTTKMRRSSIISNTMMMILGAAAVMISFGNSSKSLLSFFVFSPKTTNSNNNTPSSRRILLTDNNQFMECPTEPDTSISFTLQGAATDSDTVVSLTIPIPQQGTTASSLCTLVQVSDERNGKEFIRPIARSYNGHDWEATAGPYAGLVDIECSSQECSVQFPFEEEATYQLTSFEGRPSYSSQDLAARFLEQTTFGATLQEISNLAASSQNVNFSAWIQNQMQELPVVSHRAVWRHRLNARFEVHSPVGPVTQACAAGTRYRWTAFSIKDLYKTLIIDTIDNDKKRSLAVDGYVRTVVDSDLYVFSDGGIQPIDLPDGPYTICYVFDDDEGNAVLMVELDDYGCAPLIVTVTENFFQVDFYSNPPIRFLDNDDENRMVLDIPLQAAEPIDSVYFTNFDPQRRELLLTQDLTTTATTTCERVQDATHSAEPVFARYDNELWIHDPRHSLVENTLEHPLSDGGGALQAEFGAPFTPDFTTQCSNVPRTFLNQDTCVLSTEPSACRYTVGTEYEEDQLEDEAALFVMDDAAIRVIYEASDQSMYLYAIDGLDPTRDNEVESPCQVGSYTRWIPVRCSNNRGGLDPDITFQTARFLSGLIATVRSWFDEDELNPNMMDIYHFDDIDFRCDAADMDKIGFEVPVEVGAGDRQCWKHVHPDHWNVYDFTPWTVNHPGNLNGRNPIKEFAEAGETKLLFPDWHALSRWNLNKDQFPGPVRLGDSLSFYRLPSTLQTPVLAEALGVALEELESGSENGQSSAAGTLVCGSPHEDANDPWLGGSVGRGAFDAFTTQFQTTDFFYLAQQRQTVWTMAVMNDPAQLRQRIAWALSQILVISPDESGFGYAFTEGFLAYYDIFVRNAFGNYRDILKEVSYSRLMAEMLTYYGGRSTAYVWEEEGNLEFADENYAREIMQLFTMGLFQLNNDGTPVLDDSGSKQKVYNNDDIEEYARVWTGFISQMPRGNSEDPGYDNLIDPMYIEAEFRDRFPKMGLDGVYIGDGYPLCSDLPQKHFLTQGAKYRLVGEVPQAEMHVHPTKWKEDSEAGHLSLDNPASELYQALCASEGGACSFPVSVELESTLVCSGVECSLDTIRMVKVEGLFYEYLRQPCVYQAFYEDGKSIAQRWDDTTVMCADPRTEAAVSASCNGWYEEWTWNEFYYGERVSIETALQRDSEGKVSCETTFAPSCDEDLIGYQCYDNAYYWTGESCDVGVLVAPNGKIAILHAPQDLDPSSVASSVRSGVPKTFFRAEWQGDFQSLINDCSSDPLCKQVDGDSCACQVSVQDTQVFTTVPSREVILSRLSIGGFKQYGTPDETFDGVDVFHNGGGSLSEDSVFRVVDDNWVEKYLMNKESTVTVGGSGIHFRNPPHFMSLHSEEPRDAHYETDAALDHYFYHRNTAPFLALRFAQRFGISNPSPRYIKAIATAFKTGLYEVEESDSTQSFGSGNYGDLAATFAAVLLDREARSEILDADPIHGSLKEPLLKVIGLMRSLEFQLKEDEPFVELNWNLKNQIGQVAHRIPTVFSFFLPEYQPAGPVAQGSLVAPEAQLLTSPRVIDGLNGMFSLIRYGLNSCFGGFGRAVGDGPRNNPNCWEIARPGYQGPINMGALRYSISSGSTSASQIVDELALLMTAGRLSADNRQQIVDAINVESETDAIKTAQLLIAATPEFHATNLVRKSGEDRPTEAPPQSSTRPYKAVVYLLLSGGADTFNMLAPHTCNTETNQNGQTLLEQYFAERTSIAITEDERALIIDADDQPCEQFVVHQDLPVIKELYENGDLVFFANTGVLDRPVTKENYETLTRSDLFAHNGMQRASQRVDPWDLAPGTGILGRMSDVLASKGFSPQPITIEDATIATVGVPGAANGVSPIIASPFGLNEFDQKADEEELDVADYVHDLNDGTTLHSSIFAETWSQKLQKAISDTERLKSALDGVQLTQEYDDDEYDYQLAKINTVSKLILTHQERGSDRDIIFLEVGGWDHHEQLKENLSYNLQELNKVIDTFQKEMESQDMWNQVTMVVTSEFARTLTANSGEGSDHAWGGNYMVMGGSVKGGKILGEYPSDITTSGPLNVGRGRLIPTSSWESMLNPVLEWMGIDSEEDLDYCMPNRATAGTKLYSESDVFSRNESWFRRWRRRRDRRQGAGKRLGGVS